MNVIDRVRQDKAYLCFLPAGLLGIAAGVASAVPMDTGTAGGVGLLVLVPLVLFMLVYVPRGLYLAIALRTDMNLVALSVLTVSWIVAMLTKPGPAVLRYALSIVYGCVVLFLITMWFLRGRNKTRLA